MGKDKKQHRGRGALSNPANPYLKNNYAQVHPEGLDEPDWDPNTIELIPGRPRKIINRVTSPDIPLPFSMNPYQGCEHGCIYCYARNTHPYWGFSIGLDFEKKIVVKRNAAALLREAFMKTSWRPQPIMLSGNTDCYQPIERKEQLTRQMLEVMLEFRNPVGIITKNSLVLRDLDLIQEMASMDLVRVAISITTLQEDVRRRLEPRTATALQRLKAIEQLAQAGVPVMVMVAPVIPGLNNYEIVPIMKAAADAGASSAAFTMLRLNGDLGPLFEEWVREYFPDRAGKILHQTAELHGGSLGDSTFGRRMGGTGELAASIREVFNLSKKRYFKGRMVPEYNLNAFRRPSAVGQLSLFEAS